MVGHRVEEFLDEPKCEEVDRALARFLEKRRWSGMVCVRLKANARTLYFDCALNAIVKGDEVVGVSVLARDVTEEREKERRFTELFETLQEGVYFSTPEGRLLDGNAALVQVLGYENKEDLLSLDPRALNSDPNQSPVLGRTADDQGGVRTREIMLRRKNGTLGIFLDTSQRGMGCRREDRTLPGHAGGRNRASGDGEGIARSGRIPALPFGKFS